MTCGRCERTVLGGQPEYCWHCGRFLCQPCADEQGHCGHPAAHTALEAAAERVQ